MSVATKQPGSAVMSVSRRIAPLICLSVVLPIVWCSRAEAHVKWFCGPVDVTQSPLDLRSVLSPTLLLVGVAFLLVISVGGLADAFAARRWPRLLWQSHDLEIIEESL